MFNLLLTELMIREHQKDLLRQAEQRRLLQQALESRLPRVSFWTRLRQKIESQVIDIDCVPLLKYFIRRARSSGDTTSLKPGEGKA